MKRIAILALMAAMELSGCAHSLPASANAGQLRKPFEERIVACTLPLLESAPHRVSVHYRYRDGATVFSLQPSNPGLRNQLSECASPEDGPPGRFEGTVEIWEKT